jgi:2-polyprenyl-3-methyl-5-hydroxy-6-metoxy-1,4-benzoquinol methylase
MQFDKQYYDNIWGTVHRHDYCESLANRLIEKYGKCKILDIGTGCGMLVNLLRDKGCDAHGLEMSDHAIGNSCAGHWVRKGSITNMPFGSDSFDVIHSQGVWEYIAKEDIQQAWNECKRVGKFQEHTIDYKGSVIGEEDFVTSETEQWWKNQFYPKILVACPTHECKIYSEKRWNDNVKSFTYPNYDVLVVDNSQTQRETLIDFPVSWLVTDTYLKADMLRVTKSMEIIRQHFLARDYKYWFNLEIDVIPPNDVIEQMLFHGNNADWISHAYPNRGSYETDDQQGIGCSMLSRKIAEFINFDGAGDNMPDGWLWDKVRPSRKFKTMELWGYFPVQHLAK